MKNVNDVARSLYDGGWRSNDIEDLVDEYELSYEEACDLCLELEVLEVKNSLVRRRRI